MSGILEVLIKSSENGCMDCCCFRIKENSCCCCLQFDKINCCPTIKKNSCCCLKPISTYKNDIYAINLYYEFINRELKNILTDNVCMFGELININNTIQNITQEEKLTSGKKRKKKKKKEKLLKKIKELIDQKNCKIKEYFNKANIKEKYYLYNKKINERLELMKKDINIKSAYDLYNKKIKAILENTHKEFLKNYPDLEDNKYIDKIKTKLQDNPTSGARLFADIKDNNIFKSYDLLVNAQIAKPKYGNTYDYNYNINFITLRNTNTLEQKYLYAKLVGRKYTKYTKVYFKETKKKCERKNNGKCDVCVNKNNYKECNDCINDICCLRGTASLNGEKLHLRKINGILMITDHNNPPSYPERRIIIDICPNVFNNIEKIIKSYNLYDTLIDNHKIPYIDWLNIFISNIQIKTKSINNVDSLGTYTDKKSAELNKYIYNNLLPANAFSYKNYDVLGEKIKSKRHCALYLLIVIFIIILFASFILPIILPISQVLQ